VALNQGICASSASSVALLCPLLRHVRHRFYIVPIRANAAEFWYINRLQGEPAEGVPDVHVHPLEPLAVRLTLSKTF
jgi:hypothetical protein